MKTCLKFFRCNFEDILSIDLYLIQQILINNNAYIFICILFFLPLAITWLPLILTTSQSTKAEHLYILNN